VAREVADIVVEDDNLDHDYAVSQGRTIYNNIRKSFPAVHEPERDHSNDGCDRPRFRRTLNAIQLLWLNLVSDIFPGLALALEPAEPDVSVTPVLMNRSSSHRTFRESPLSQPPLSLVLLQPMGAAFSDTAWTG